MSFRLVGGHIGRTVIPPEERRRVVYDAFRTGADVRPGMLRRFLVAHHVTAIVVAPGTPARRRRLVESLGLPAVHAVDAVVYRP
jgi:hypothetical protein